MSFPHSIGSQWGNSIASSATSYRSEKLSPGPISPSLEQDFVPYSPYQDRSRGFESEKGSGLVQKLPQGGYAYVCECCMKKPKRFKSVAELRSHEAEKLYKCQYCPNRFKNKNEAERHQNSLHLRRFSWSCAALNAVQNAYQPLDIQQSAFDVCGYCGEQFPNEPEPDFTQRTEHLIVIHKYGECNQHKKFFRADHFRQHLKHSHGAKSGKWTNILETACVRDEPLPTPMSSQPAVETVASMRAKLNGEGRPEVEWMFFLGAARRLYRWLMRGLDWLLLAAYLHLGSCPILTRPTTAWNESCAFTWESVWIPLGCMAVYVRAWSRCMVIWGSWLGCLRWGCILDGLKYLPIEQRSRR